jgi:hypothetical protein
MAELMNELKQFLGPFARENGADLAVGYIAKEDRPVTVDSLHLEGRVRGL